MLSNQVTGKNTDELTGSALLALLFLKHRNKCGDETTVPQYTQQYFH